jgi:fatty-acyl-CoA synthase
MTPSFVKGPTDLPLLDVTISQALADAAKRCGNKEALVVGHQNVRWTWLQLEQRVDALARGLLALGFRPGVHFQPCHRPHPAGRRPYS